MKAKVRAYWKEYDHLTARPHDIYTTRDGKKLKKVQKAAFHQHYLGKFNKAFIPTDGTEKAIVTVDQDDHVIIKIGKISKRLLEVDPIRLAIDPDNEVAAVVAQAPGAKIFRIQCGQYEYTQSQFVEPTLLSRQIQRFQQKYDNSEEWLKGIVAYYFDKTSDMNLYSVAVEKKRLKLKAERAAARARARYWSRELEDVQYAINLISRKKYLHAIERERLEWYTARKNEIIANLKK
jgi:hypothetical protein